MPETAIAPVAAPNQWDTDGIALSFTALDNANGNSFELGTKDLLLIVRNTGGSPQTFTVTSQPDTKTGRTGDVSVSIAASATYLFRLTDYGWASAGVIVTPTGLSTDLEVAAVDL